MKKFLHLIFFALLVSSCVSSSTQVSNQNEEMSKDLLCANGKTQTPNSSEKNCLSLEELKQLEEKERRDLLSEQRRRARMGS